MLALLKNSIMFFLWLIVASLSLVAYGLTQSFHLVRGESHAYTSSRSSC